MNKVVRLPMFNVPVEVISKDEEKNQVMLCYKEDGSDQKLEATVSIDYFDKNAKEVEVTPEVVLEKEQVLEGFMGAYETLKGIQAALKDNKHTEAWDLVKEGLKDFEKEGDFRTAIVKSMVSG